MTPGLLALLTAAAAASTGGMPSQVRLGATLPLTGGEAKVGARIREGYQLAIEQQNALGGVSLGVRRLPVSLEIVDDGGEPAVGARETERMIRSGTNFLLGSFGVPLHDADSAVAERLGVPYVGLVGSPTDLQRSYRNFFSVLSPVEQLTSGLLRWVEAHQKAGELPVPLRVAVAFEDTGHGREFHRAVREFASGGRSATLVFDEQFALKTADFKPLLGRLAAARADAVLIDAHLAEFIGLQREYAALGLCHQVLSYGPRGTEAEARKALPRGATDYLVSTVWWSPQLGSKGRSRDFVEAFQARYHHQPEWYEALGYEAARALMAAVEQAGSLDRAKVRDALTTLRLPSLVPSGMLSFAGRQIHQASYLSVVQQNLPDGTSPVVYPPIAAASLGVAPNPRCPTSAAAAH